MQSDPREVLINSGCVNMRFKMTNPKAASASHSTAMAKLANAGVGDFGRIKQVAVYDLSNLPYTPVSDIDFF